jgi:hypothetical protein
MSCIGSISSGTLRAEDLLEAFASELEGVTLTHGDELSRPENFSQRDRINSLIWDARECDPDSMDADGLVEELIDALNEYAAPYTYFGAHPGDGADFGYWPSLDAIEELPVVADSDEARELGEDCRRVNDHGNVTVYGGDGEEILSLA